MKDKLQYYLDSQNYFSIRQLKEGDLYSHPSENGIYYNCNKILEQHWLLYHHCQRFGKASRELGTVKEQEEYSNAFRGLSNLIDELELHLIQEPRKMHLGNFEKVHLAAAAFDHTILGHFTKGFQAAHGENEDVKIEKIRMAAIDVCEELALEIALQTNNDHEDKNGENVVSIRGVQIDKERQEVIYKAVRSSFKLGRLPWTMIRRCVEDCEEGIGKASLDSFLQRKTKDELHRVVSRMNQAWKKTGENVFRIHNDCFCVDPQPVKR